MGLLEMGVSLLKVGLGSDMGITTIDQHPATTSVLLL